MTIALFVFGAIWGSFVDVLAMRYHPDKFLFHRDAIGGRSRCSACGRTLRWFELIPIVSFLAQLGKCRSCKTRIHPEHVVAEVLSGLIFVAVPQVIQHGGIYLRGAPWATIVLSVIWIAVFLLLLLIALIDLRWQIIPDEINVMLVVLGVALVFVETYAGTAPYSSFLGPYGLLFGIQLNPWINLLAGAFTGAAFFGFLILVTRGHGMGMGDLKLVAALGAVFRFPDIIVVSALSFVIGSLVSIAVIALRKKTLQSTISFGPFIALGALTLFFFGESLTRAYFSLIQ